MESATALREFLNCLAVEVEARARGGSDATYTRGEMHGVARALEICHSVNAIEAIREARERARTIFFSTGQDWQRELKLLAEFRRTFPVYPRHPHETG